MHPNGKIVRRFYAARAQGDRDEVAKLLTSDIRWHEPERAYGSLSKDLEGIDAVFTEMFDVLERDYSSGMEVHDVVSNEEHTIALVAWWAERAGERIEGREVAVYHIVDGRIAEAWFFTDGDYSAFFA